ncbi:hypothetical protein AOCH_000293 [Aspergillus ochraceoroseus]|uniref:Autophagy-related protein 14 n=1 Tax=Aspergillus ochraceoroseus TaxID=138278 RepID=A0A0F8X279_9EURO|nr:hypothetical protein AOCH_000293 [Aspergillus ochraceoroseus]
MQAESSGRIKIIANEIESLGSAIKNKKFEISQRKLELARRRSDSESARYQLAEREGAMLASTQNNIKRTDHLWHSLHSKTAEARIFLCREAASLYGLRQKVRRRDNVTEETYVIGGVSIIELRNLNGKSRLISIHLSTSANTQAGASPDHISTLFSYIAHLLVLVSHYLSLRLPAEITLPHRNYPTPTIYTPSASYLPREAYSVSFPSQSLGSSPTSSRTADSRPPPHRPRPLSIDKTLPKLAREDPSTYALFLEGVTLLAWNVSWLCRSQGLNLASDSWEDICDIGKNMWQLLVAPPAQPSSLIRALTAHDLQTKIKKTPKDSPKTTIQRTKSFPMLGHYSHGTAHSFLGASEGTEFIRSWKLPTPTKVVDKLKSTLLGEMASAEWELLEEKEWDDAVQEPTQAVPQEPVNVSDPTSDNKPRVGGAGSIISQPATLDSANSPARSKGTSGWTKLRNR